jgi:hypothetical protein
MSLSCKILLSCHSLDNKNWNGLTLFILACIVVTSEELGKPELSVELLICSLGKPELSVELLICSEILELIYVG